MFILFNCRQSFQFHQIEADPAESKNNSGSYNTFFKAGTNLVHFPPSTYR